MRLILGIGAVAALAFLFLATAFSQEDRGVTHSKVTMLDETTYPRVTGKANAVSGDTLIFADGTKIRLMGVDSPSVEQQCKIGESFYPCGQEAKDFLQRLIDGKTVDSFVYGSEKWSCYVGEVFVQELMIRDPSRVSWKKKNGVTSC